MAIEEIGEHNMEALRESHVPQRSQRLTDQTGENTDSEIFTTKLFQPEKLQDFSPWKMGSALTSTPYDTGAL